MFEGRGGHVILPPGCTLLNDPAELYGYESHDKDGKLIQNYLPYRKKAAQKASEPSPAPVQLTAVQPSTAEGRVPLMKLPDGEQPAWDRSGHTIHV
jgi:hypothetical protein